MTEQFLTRRQLRELEKSGKSAAEFTAETQQVESRPAETRSSETQVAIAIETIVAPAFFDDDFIPHLAPPIVERPAVKWLSTAKPAVNVVAVESISAPINTDAFDDSGEEYEDEQDITNSDFFTQGVEVVEQLFDVSPNLILEPTTNSIVIDNIDRLDNFTGTITETGEILKTGSIELPLLLSNTGELEIISAAEHLDAAIAAEAGSGFVSTIAPVRATGIVNSASRFKILPANLKKGQGQVYLVLTAAILMVAVGALTIAGFMLGIL